MSFHTKIAGVTFRNRTGPSRQKLIQDCLVGETLFLVREPKNRHDSGAIAVYRESGQKLGYIPQHVSRGGDSSGLAERIDDGINYRCRISSLTGGGEYSLGVNIEITDGEWAEPEATKEWVPSQQVLHRSPSFGWLLIVVGAAVAMLWLFAK